MASEYEGRGPTLDLDTGLFSQSAWAGASTIMHYPFWPILVIALSIWVIWSITRPGVIET